MQYSCMFFHVCKILASKYARTYVDVQCIYAYIYIHMYICTNKYYSERETCMSKGSFETHYGSLDIQMSSFD